MLRLLIRFSVAIASERLDVALVGHRRHIPNANLRDARCVPCVAGVS